MTVASSVLIAAALAAHSPDQTSAADVARPAAANPIVLREGASIPLATIAELNSLTARQGERFELVVTDDVMAAGYVAIPRGARAFGEIRRVTGKGMVGKRGKLEVQLLFVELDGHRIRIDGRAADGGTSGLAPAVGTAILAGAIGGFVTGTSARLPAGTAMTGYLYRDLSLAPPQ